MNPCYPFVNTPLPYAYDALEPFIDQKTMYLHHDSHLQTYIDRLNALLEPYPHLQGCSLTDLLSSLWKLPCPLRTSIGNQAGGVYCHRFFFEGMSPGGRQPNGKLLPAIQKQFGSFDQFKKLFSKQAAAVFGSGYAWLVFRNGALSILTTANQDTPLLEGYRPLINLDVWEHAYYLKHYNLRADYIQDWFQVVNWEMAELRFQNALSSAPLCPCRHNI